MELEETAAAVLPENEQLRHENDMLRMMLSLAMENIDLKTRMQSFISDTPEEITVCPTSERTPCSLIQNTCDEKQFRKDFEPTKAEHEHRTSSPVDFNSFLQGSVHTDASESQSCQADIPLEVKDRLLGDIAYQLNARILSHIFQGQRRLYGFTMLNIPDKIMEVSTLPLTGKVDEGYRLHLTQRHVELMERLSQLGYNKTLHPPFAEFIINTYGVLKDRSSEFSTQAVDYNNPDLLKNVILTTAPRKLQKDLLVLLTCLCNMAEEDRKPLLGRHGRIHHTWPQCGNKH